MTDKKKKDDGSDALACLVAAILVPVLLYYGFMNLGKMFELWFGINGLKAGMSLAYASVGIWLAFIGISLVFELHKKKVY